MIDGFVIEVSAEEMAGLYRKRAERWRERAGDCEKELAEIAATNFDTLPDAMQYMRGPGPGLSQRRISHPIVDPVEQVKETIRMRMRSANAYAVACEFIASHVILGERYRISIQEFIASVELQPDPGYVLAA